MSTSLPPWPPAEGLSTVIVPRTSATHSFYSTTQISAPASFVFSLLLDTASYPSWNTFTPRVEIHSQPTSASSSPSPSPSAQTPDTTFHNGTKFTFHVVMDPAHPDSVHETQLRVTDLSTPAHPTSYIPADILSTDGSFEKDAARVYRVSWTVDGGLVSRGLSGERVSEVIVLKKPSAEGADGGEQEEGEECIYRTWECQSGLLARVVKIKYGKTLFERFDANARDVKEEAERRWREQKQGGNR